MTDRDEIKRLRALLRQAATLFAEVIADSPQGELTRPYFKAAENGLLVCRDKHQE